MNLLQDEIKQIDEVLIWWALRDFAFLPAQPDSKKVVPGYGIYKNHFTDWESAAAWYQTHSAANVGIIAPKSAVILDFDRVDLYAWFRTYSAASASYTEFTPRGGAHVFLYHAAAERLRRARWIDGIECKAAAIVYPSAIDGKQYRREPYGEILDFDNDLTIFDHLLVEFAQETKSLSEKKTLATGTDVLSKIKAQIWIPDILRECAPVSYKTIHGRGRWLSARCPFSDLHEDKKASFWIDTERFIWGCHGCKSHGDVVNLYSRLRGIEVQQGITELARRLS